MAIPLLHGSDARIPPAGTLVSMVGLGHASKQIAPVGVGRIEHQRAVSARALKQTRLDYLGYVAVSDAQQALLENYIAGGIDLPQFVTRLEAGGMP